MVSSHSTVHQNTQYVIRVAYCVLRIAAYWMNSRHLIIPNDLSKNCWVVIMEAAYLKLEPVRKFRRTFSVRPLMASTSTSTKSCRSFTGFRALTTLAHHAPGRAKGHKRAPKKTFDFRLPRVCQRGCEPSCYFARPGDFP